MNALDQIKREESYRRFPYTDTVGKWTWGYGWNLEAEGVDEDIAAMVCERKINKIIASLRQAYSWFDALSVPRQGVLINMAYQMGLFGLSQFSDTLTRIENGDYGGASKGMLNSKWATQTPQRAIRLSEQMRKDEWV